MTKLPYYKYLNEPEYIIFYNKAVLFCQKDFIYEKEVLKTDQCMYVNISDACDCIYQHLSSIHFKNTSFLR